MRSDLFFRFMSRVTSLVAAPIKARSARQCARLLFFFAFGVVALAQTVRWEPPGGMLPVGQSIALGLIFEDCAPKSRPAPPKVDGLALQFYGQSENTQIVNGA